MNVELLNRVAFEIEFNDRFNMAAHAAKNGRYDNSITPAEVLNECGTTACVCGWVNALTGHFLLTDEYHAATVLGLTGDQSQELFYAKTANGQVWSAVIDDSDSQAWDATSVQASKLLRMIATGEATFACDNT